MNEDDLRGDPGNEWKGAGYVCTPPLRPKHHHDHLWRGLQNYDLQVVATDADSSSVTYSLVDGVDSGQFSIDPVTGILRFGASGRATRRPSATLTACRRPRLR